MHVPASAPTPFHGDQHIACAAAHAPRTQQRKKMVEPFLDVLREYQSFMPMCAVRGVPIWCRTKGSSQGSGRGARADMLNAQTC